eukprot:COSAG01_NODE_13702_length_1546_cov_8.788528_2_plen_23_part_01
MDGLMDGTTCHEKLLSMKLLYQS